MIKWRGKYTEKDLNGIYGLYINKRLVYIGSTQQSFSLRLVQHNQKIGKSTSMLYQCLYVNRNHLMLSMKPLIITKYVRTSQPITSKELGWMELALISAFRPIYNTMGVKANFTFPH